MIPGKSECTYVDVQMKRRITRRRDWKLKIAVWMDGRIVSGMGWGKVVWLEGKGGASYAPSLDGR
jgi:hypothetical protein